LFSLRRGFLLLILLLIALIPIVFSVRIMINDVETKSLQGSFGLQEQESLASNLVDIADWVNHQPITLEQLRGNVILLDFWTYSCVNCIRTLPYLRSWHKRYSDDGFIIIGIHSPEFDFEKSLPNVRREVHRLDIPWPIALDNARTAWRAYGVRAWPTKILIGKDGTIRHEYAGEGAYSDTEKVIRALLEEEGYVLGRLYAESPIEPNFSEYRGITREIYAGGLWAAYSFPPYLGNGNPSNVDPTQFVIPDKRVKGSFYLQGIWRQTDENIVHSRSSPDFSDYILVSYVGGEVNSVIQNLGTSSFKVKVILDGVPIPSDYRGADVVWDQESQETYVVVKEDRMYQLTRSNKDGSHELVLAPESDNFGLHTFTFGP
jgi:thiol-disulfide isomerase/thioredoxin